MMRRACIGVGLVGAVLLLAACAATGSHPARPSPLDEDALRSTIRTLAADDFDGRRPGTAGEQKTLQYLVAEFKRMGLKPGNGASYLQPVPVVEITAQPGAVLSFAGHGRVRSLVYRHDMVIWTRRELAEAGLVHSPMMFVGYGIVAPQYGWNDYAGVDVRGKTVVALVNDPGYATRDPKVFMGGTMTRYGGWRYKLNEAARHGAAGVLLVHDTAAAGFDWDVVVNRFSGPQLEAPAVNGGGERAAIEGWLSAAAARQLFAAAGVDFGAVTAAASRPGFRAIALHLVADAEIHNAIRRFASANVIALLPGHKQRREYVVYSAHWDSLGRAGGRPSGAVFDGAVDNASGVAGLLLLAKSFSATQPPPGRSMVFLAPTGGESGLLGSRYYVEHPPYPLADTVADINLDMLHIGGPTRDVSVIGFGQSELERYLSAAALLQGRTVRAEPNPQQGLYFGSDALSFAEHGVPALYAVGGIDDDARGPIWGKAQLDAYRLHRFCQIGDQYAPDWNLRGTLEDLRLYYAVGMRLADTRRFPNWYPNSEFRAIRTRSREEAGD